MRLLPHLAMTLCTAACAVAPRGERADLDPTPVLELRADDFPAAASLLDGIAEPDDDPALRVGDAALLALEFRRGARVERQLLLFEVVELPIVRTAFGDVEATGRRTTDATLTITPSGCAPRSRTYTLRDVIVRVRRFTADGRELARADTTLYEETLRAGWWPDTEPTSNEDQRAMADMLTFSLQRLANDEPTLQEALFLVVDAPSLWSLATHLGVQVVVRTAFAPSEPFHFCSRPGGLVEGHVHRIDVDLNGGPALEADLLILEPRGARMVCAGLLGAVARNPRDPDRNLAVCVLATRRGPAAQ